MDKALIIEKLEMLVSLIEETEPDVPNEKNLFSHHAITAMEMLKKVRDFHTGRNIQDPDSEREELISMMKSANRIWKTRNKIKNGEWDSLEMLEVHDTIEDYIAQGQKINAIKYYRQEMSDKLGEQVSLREAKEYIDKISDDMRLRGI
jgi:ribosomal protein L7/L12